MEFGKTERVALPAMRVASYEVTSGEPERVAIDFMEKWLENRNLFAGANGVRGFGFDCHKGRSIPDGSRIYRVYYSVPKSVQGDADVAVKQFAGGNFATLVITDPFSGDFPQAWGVLLKWAADNHAKNRLGCTRPDDVYSLFSNEDSPCLEEIFCNGGVQYMAIYLPIE